MASVATLPSSPPDVAAVLDACPAPARLRLMEVRDLILATAAEMPEVGVLTETLKWRQPAYLTNQTKSGTTLRLGWADDGTSISLFVHCQTSLVSEWRQRYEEALTFVGNRELVVAADQPLPVAPLQHCIAMALTYHARKR